MKSFKPTVLTGCLSILALTSAGSSFAAEIPQGKITGSAIVHTETSMKLAIENAWTAFPKTLTGGNDFNGLLKDAPKLSGKAPVLVFVHGSGGINPQIKLFQKWLAETLGVASIMLDSMQLLDRMKYSSPIPPEEYEKVHALRASELKAAVYYVSKAPWFDGRLAIAGTSEGGVTVARYQAAANAPKEKARIIFSWSCEDNYHVTAHRTAIPNDLPVLNVMSATDKFFSASNPYIGNKAAVGHCGKALANNPNAEIVLIPKAPHTLLNLTQTHEVVEGFLKDRLLK